VDVLYLDSRHATGVEVPSPTRLNWRDLIRNRWGTERVTADAQGQNGH
jgi:hypothetical protein